MDSPAHLIISRNLHSLWVAAPDKVVEYAVHDVLLVNPNVAVGEEVVLERSKLDAEPVGDVVDSYRSEIGQARPGTDCREFIRLDM